MIDMPLTLNKVRQKTITHVQLNKQIARQCSTIADAAFRQASAVLSTNIDRATFFSDFAQASTDMLYHLANWETSNLNLVFPPREKIVFVGWQFPELPLLFHLIRDKHVLVVTAQDAPWLEKLKYAGCFVSPMTRQGRSNLEHAMSAGRLIGIAGDAIQPSRQTANASLFGQYVAMNDHILEQAVINHYSLMFLAPRSKTIEITDTLPKDRFTKAGAAKWINQCLQREIQRAPHRWLMWSSLSYRVSKQL